jgi:PIN domain nuclease of toxin-antitoxin system
MLLDTHSFLWFIMGNERLPAKVREAIANTDNENYLSMASVWEMAIKTSLGKLILEKPFESLIPEQIRASNIRLLDIKLDHAARVAALPFHHRDPFDRLIVAQALSENIPLASGDDILDKYDIQRYW